MTVDPVEACHQARGIERPQTAVETSAQRVAVVDPVDRAPRTQEGVLESVLGVVERAEHAVAVGVELAAARLDEPAEGVLVTPAGSLEQTTFVNC